MSRNWQFFVPKKLSGRNYKFKKNILVERTPLTCIIVSFSTIDVTAFMDAATFSRKLYSGWMCQNFVNAQTSLTKPRTNLAFLEVTQNTCHPTFLPPFFLIRGNEFTASNLSSMTFNITSRSTFALSSRWPCRKKRSNLRSLWCLCWSPSNTRSFHFVIKRCVSSGRWQLRYFSQVGRQLSISRKPLSVFGKIFCLWLIGDSMQDHITMITGGSSALVRLVVSRNQEIITFYTIAT